MRLWFYIVCIFIMLPAQAQKHTISGYVKDDVGEALIGANVYVKELKSGTATNSFGFYSITLPADKYTIVYSYIGFNDEINNVALNMSQRVDVNLTIVTEEIEELVITSEGRDANITEVEMSTEKLHVKTIKKIPVLFGEVDVVKSLQLLPGVQSGVEGSSGFYVRGGNVDQNLVLLDDAPVYNVSHLFGFFSVFNGDAVKDIKLYKGGIPAEYGGRLSSILDVKMKEGNTKEIHGTGGIGLISSRLSIDGPIIKDKSSFNLSGRRTYGDILFLSFAKDSLQRESSFYFYDFNAKVNLEINNNNKIFLSGYFGRDVNALGSLINLSYGNGTGTIRWSHLFNSRFFMNTRTTYSNYAYRLKGEMFGQTFDWLSHIIDYSTSADFSYFISPSNTMKTGFSSVYHTFMPGTIEVEIPDTSGISTSKTKLSYEISNNYAIENAVYIQDELEFRNGFSVQYGLRVSAFSNRGEAASFVFDKTNSQGYTIEDTLRYNKGKLFNTYVVIEPRIGMKYTIDKRNAVKANYNRMSQYVHLLSNTTATMPIDIWIPSSPNIKPQYADQWAVGYFRNFMDNALETSMELFYKRIYNAIDFKDHAELLINNKYEGEVRIGEGWSYGAEFYVKKQTGKITGWVSYAYIRAKKRIPEINKGETYNASFDKPHNISVVASYDIKKNINVSANWVYSTAPPRTVILQRAVYMNEIFPVYSERNAVRYFDYHRLDLSGTFYLKKKKKYEHNLVVSIYNVYNRHNPYSFNIIPSEENSNIMETYKYYIFAIIPSVTYNMNF